MRTVLVLAGVAAALLLFIVFVERDTVSDGELAKREGRVLQNFIRKRVDTITVTGPEGEVRMVRKPDPEGIMEDGIWFVESPYKSEADQRQVDALLGELEWMDARRRLEDVSEEDRKNFGLNDPQYRLSYKVGRDEGQLAVGNESPKGDGHYVSIGDPSVAYVIGKDLTEALKQPPASYHSKIMHDGVMLDTSLKITVRDAGGEQRVAQRDGRFWLEGSSPRLASRPALEALIQSIDNLQAKRYVGEGKKDLSRYGLDKPVWAVTILRKQLRDGADRFEKVEDRVVESPLRFRLGAPCGENEGERYATLDDTVYCVAEAEIAEARAATADLVDHRLAPVEARKVGHVVIEARKPEKGTLTLGSGEDGWTYQVGSSKAQTAEQGSVDAWLGVITEAKSATPPQVVPASQPDATVTFGREGKTLLTLRLFVTPEGLLVARDGEDGARLYPAELAQAFDVSGDVFRARKVLDYVPEALQSVAVEMGDRRQRAERDDQGTFQLAQPAKAPADVAHMARLARMLAELTVEGFETRSVHPEAFREGEVEAVFDEGGKPVVQRFTLLGSVAGDHWLARKGDDTLMVVAPEFARALSTPWLARTYAAPPLDRIEMLTIAGPRGCKVKRDGDNFAFAEGPGTPEQARHLVMAWAGLRIGQVSSSEAPAKDATEIQITVQDGKRDLALVIDGEDEALIAPAFAARLSLAPGTGEALVTCPR